MFEDEKDFSSRMLSISTNVLVLDSPRRTVYGVIFGLFLQVIGQIISWAGGPALPINTFQYIIIGIAILHLRTIFETIFKKRKFSEKFEEQFAVINEAESKGLSKAHIKIQLLHLCQLALKDATLDPEVQNKLLSFGEKAKDE